MGKVRLVASIGDSYGIDCCSNVSMCTIRCDDRSLNVHRWNSRGSLTSSIAIRQLQDYGLMQSRNTTTGSYAAATSREAKALLGVHSAFALVSGPRPAAAGEVITLFATGLGLALGGTRMC